MIRRWYLLTALICLAAAGAAAGVSLWPRSGQISTPSSPVRILAAVEPSPGAASPSTDTLIRQYQQAVRAAPSDAAAYANLGMAYMQKERETADVSYYQLTEAAASQALHLDGTNQTALTLETWVALGRHDFVAAASLASQATRLDSGNAESYANLGDAEANLGNYDAMATAYQHMVDLKPDLASYNRASYVRWLYGDERGATRFMLLAIRAGSTARENVAWCESQLGDDFFNAGFVTGAQQMYHLALHAFPHYARALAGLANVAIALHHPEQAVRYYRQAIAIVPLPQFVTGLGDLYASLGRSAEANQQYALIRLIDHIFAINHVRYGIDEAQFDADHGQNLAQALQLATAETATRHDIQTMDTLAWVLYQNGRYGDAWRAERRAMSLGTHFAPLYFHAGMIEEKLGDLVSAQNYLSRALMLNPNFSVLYAPVAQRELVKLNARAAGTSRG